MSGSYSDTHIPRNLNAAPMFLIFEGDIAFGYIVIVLLFSVMNMFVVGVMAGEIFRRVYSKIKAEGGRGLIVRLLYWFTPLQLSDGTIGSEYREFYGS